MLCLSRKEGEVIKIGDDVYITVIKLKGNSVRIGVLAPREVHVIRLELEGVPSMAHLQAQRRIDAREEAELRAIQEAEAQAEADWQRWAEREAAHV